MTKRKRAAMWVAVLSIILGAIILHVVQWHFTGMYLSMTGWIGTDRAYMIAVYNLGLMVLLGVVIGILIERITDLISYETRKVKTL